MKIKKYLKPPARAPQSTCPTFRLKTLRPTFGAKKNSPQNSALIPPVLMAKKQG